MNKFMRFQKVRKKSINLRYSCWNYVRPVRSHELGLRIAYVEMMIDDAWPTFSELFAKILHNGSESGSMTLANQTHIGVTRDY